MDLKDLLSWQPETPKATVKIGPATLEVHGLLSAGDISAAFNEGQARGDQTFKDEDGKPIMLEDSEAMAYTFLVKGLAHLPDEQKPGFEHIVAISRKTGMDCITAGQKVMELSGLMQDAVDEQKNA